MISAFSIFVIVLLVFAVAIVFMGVKIVPQGEEYTVKRFGRYTKTLRPGLHRILPLVDRIGMRQNMMEQVMDVDSQEVITKDNAMITVDGVVFYQVLDAVKASYEVRQLRHATLNLTMTNIRTVMPFEASSVIGSVACLGEIAKEAFGDNNRGSGGGGSAGGRSRSGSVPSSGND
jgi:regulator of protease activity HflC (stomatin/prohibitin superfamily)